ncbi:hypothetical protein L596_011535 [Steinernema carpocapsae]|uniref:HTH OST-type domain-containing protein n=1 Tax=Steinernema carpocapsae TaxID=34508 RepID=A0A4U5NU77_STECR|nr:hypothetical protein L596_011535 [Steinernema carpocapsae]
MSENIREEAEKNINWLLLWHHAQGVSLPVLADDYRKKHGHPFPVDAFGSGSFDSILREMRHVIIENNNLVRGKFSPSDFFDHESAQADAPIDEGPPLTETGKKVLQMILDKKAAGLPVRMLKMQLKLKKLPEGAALAKALGLDRGTKADYDLIVEALQGFVELDGKNQIVAKPGAVVPKSGPKATKADDKRRLTIEEVRDVMKVPATYGQFCGRIKERYKVTVTNENAGKLLSCEGTTIYEALAALEQFGIVTKTGLIGAVLYCEELRREPDVSAEEDVLVIDTEPMSPLRLDSPAASLCRSPRRRSRSPVPFNGSRGRNFSASGGGNFNASGGGHFNGGGGNFNGPDAKRRRLPASGSYSRPPPPYGGINHHRTEQHEFQSPLRSVTPMNRMMDRNDDIKQDQAGFLSLKNIIETDLSSFLPRMMLLHMKDTKKYANFIAKFQGDLIEMCSEAAD